MKKDTNSTIDALADLAIYSEGSLTYSELKQMTVLEINRVQQRLNAYYKAKAEAAGATPLL